MTAAGKELVWCEKSAHTPQYNEPAKFRSLLVRYWLGVADPVGLDLAEAREQLLHGEP
jgi:hypothetical protein